MYIANDKLFELREICNYKTDITFFNFIKLQFRLLIIVGVLGYLLVFGLSFETVSAEINYNDTAKEKIAFVANVDGNWDLFISYFDGTNRERLTETAYDEADPAWSPNNESIAFSASDGNLRIIDLESGEIHVYKPKSDDMRYCQPSYSPDAKNLAISIHYRGLIDRTDFAVLNLTDSSLVIPAPQGTIQLFPCWSPNGNTIYYTNVTCNVNCGRIIQEIWSIAWPDGYPQQELLTNSHCQSPNISNDGSELVFSSNKGGGFDLWRHSYISGETICMTTDSALDIKPSWSGDGSLVVFVSTRDNGFGIYILDVKTGEIDDYKPFDNKNIECKDPAISQSNNR